MLLSVFKGHAHPMTMNYELLTAARGAISCFCDMLDGFGTKADKIGKHAWSSATLEERTAFLDVTKRKINEAISRTATTDEVAIEFTATERHAIESGIAPLIKTLKSLRNGADLVGKSHWVEEIDNYITMVDKDLRSLVLEQTHLELEDARDDKTA